MAINSTELQMGDHGTYFLAELSGEELKKFDPQATQPQIVFMRLSVYAHYFEQGGMVVQGYQAPSLFASMQKIIEHEKKGAAEIHGGQHPISPAYLLVKGADIQTLLPVFQKASNICIRQRKGRIAQEDLSAFIEEAGGITDHFIRVAEEMGCQPLPERKKLLPVFAKMLRANNLRGPGPV